MPKVFYSDAGRPWVGWLPGEKVSHQKARIPTIARNKTRCLVIPQREGSEDDPGKLERILGFLDTKVAYNVKHDYFELPLESMPEVFIKIRAYWGWIDPWLSRGAFAYMSENNLWEKVR
jgi:hypothetical protein